MSRSNFKLSHLTRVVPGICIKKLLQNCSSFISRFLDVLQSYLCKVELHLRLLWYCFSKAALPPFLWQTGFSLLGWRIPSSCRMKLSSQMPRSRTMSVLHFFRGYEPPAFAIPRELASQQGVHHSLKSPQYLHPGSLHYLIQCRQA